MARAVQRSTFCSPKYHNLKKRLNSTLNSEQMVISSKFIYNNLIYLIAKVNKFVEEIEFHFLHQYDSSVSVHSVTHCQSQCIQYVQSILANVLSKNAQFYFIPRVGLLESLKFQH